VKRYGIRMMFKHKTSTLIAIVMLAFGITATDPLTFLLVAVVLTATAFIACWVPARRAAKVDPLYEAIYEDRELSASRLDFYSKHVKTARRILTAQGCHPRSPALEEAIHDISVNQP